ncbi:thioredoxin [Desulfatibacillum aliphaticivorans]|uniref:Thioredoxin n=1 Tax=Desulfatibacillum aliphaticivorans TaxID=218208 RepID=B8F937_DESAL|nr:thioredoxin [Desulfatibacillum aliphaticivorans]ACL02783.1 thioredoxin [Desulfatibacillum aliphaticivorans]
MEINETSFGKVTGKGVSLVDFYATWCGPCKAQEPIIKELEKNFSGRAVVTKMDVDQNRDTAAKLGISSIPTVVVFKDGKEVERFIGLQNQQTLSAALESALI